MIRSRSSQMVRRSAGIERIAPYSSRPVFAPVPSLHGCRGVSGGLMGPRIAIAIAGVFLLIDSAPAPMAPA